MKYIYSLSLVFALLFSSCSRQGSITKTTDRQANTVAYKSVKDTVISPVIKNQPVYHVDYINPRDYYEDAYTQLGCMLDGIQPQSFKKAVFITENAWFQDQLKYDTYNNYINALANVTKAWKKANHLVYDKWDFDSNEVALNGAIYHIMSDTVKDEQGNTIMYPYHYDFNDCFGHDNWTNMFVAKLMSTHGGNCHSLPFLYKIIAEELGTKAYLCLLPQHIYINQYSRKTSWYNTELTGKCFPVDAWLMTTGYVSVQSIRTGLYMDTLSEKQSIAVSVNDLAKGYQRKFGDEDFKFILKCCDLGLKYYPNYGELLLLKAETLKKLYQKDIELYGLNAPDSKEHGDKILAVHTQMEQTYNVLAKLDYREIPDGLYKHWTEAMINGGNAETENIHDTVITTNVYGPNGKKMDMIAVSNGKFVELFENDTLRRIGSVMFNTKRHTVEYFILKDDESYSAELDRPKESGRFLSVDPITKQFPQLSPYQYASDRPIDGIDMDGLENWQVSAAGAMAIASITNKEITAEDITKVANTEIAGAIMGSKIVIPFLLCLLPPPIAIPTMIGYWTGVPISPSPQAMSEAIAGDVGNAEWDGLMNALDEDANKLPGKGPVLEISTNKTPVGTKTVSTNTTQTNQSISGFKTPTLLQEHFDKHASEFGGQFKTEVEYEAAAKNFLGSSSKDIQTYTRDNGDIVKYNAKTNEFGILSKDKAIRTYFKPQKGQAYYNNDKAKNVSQVNQQKK